MLVPASAQVYKWVDEHGTTHYGQRPPPGRKAEQIGERLANPAPPAAAARPDWKEQDLEFRSRRIKAEQAEARREQQQAADRRACNLARDNLAQMKVARRLYRLDEKGERVYASDAEHEAAVARQEAMVAQRCR